MRLFMLSTAVVVANAIAAAAIESLSDAVKDFPQCSLSAFKKALDKEGCDVKSVGGGTFDCMCKHLESIVVTMSTSGIDANCEANWSSALTQVCAQWELYSTTVTDYPQATKALASELGGAGNDASPTSTASDAADSGSISSGGSATAASATSSKGGAAAAATPVIGLLGAAALAGMLV